MNDATKIAEAELVLTAPTYQLEADLKCAMKLIEEFVAKAKAKLDEVKFEVPR